MHWVLLIVSILLFVAWLFVHFVLGFTIGVFNMLWMVAFLFVLLWAAQWSTD
ncbi:MAG TPA: hypothetical protein VIU85_03935 [Chthoniobacterales bacterium]